MTSDNYHLITRITMILVFCFVTQTCELNPARSLSPQNINTTSNSTPIDYYHLINDKQGWMQSGNRLFWTDNAGSEWKNITPTSLNGWSIGSVFFLNNLIGWSVLVYPDVNGTDHFGFAKTTNSGGRWNFQTLILFNPGDPGANVDKIYLKFINEEDGWMVVKRVSSPTFSNGTLFRTSDGGTTWVKMAIPIGEPVNFINQSRGWTAGGANGDELYTSQDGGSTWTQVSLSEFSIYNEVAYHLPTFDQSGTGYLPVTSKINGQSKLNIYQSLDSGNSWVLLSSTSSGSTTNNEDHFAIAGSGNWVVEQSNGKMILGSKNGVEREAVASILGNKSNTPSVLPGNQSITGISSLDMATQSAGWATSQSGDCSQSQVTGRNQETPRICSTTTNLLRTSDGGITWQTLSLPPAESVPQGITKSQVSPITSQGFDTCEVPTVDQMSTWITHSPYNVFNLYIGGSWLGCKQAKMSLITNDYIGHLSQLGWKFTPTWVGLQAPCYCPTCSGKPQMSSDPNSAYNQGVIEANAAIETAANLGLTDTGKSGTIIYYDMEAFDVTNTDCRNAVRSFINGWTYQLHSRLNHSGIYTTSCALSKLDLSSLTNVPDDIWPAYWLIPFQFRSDASVYGIYCLSDQAWVNHQRIHQYSGEHNETWGGVMVAALDNNVLDGTVAMWSNNGTDCPQTGGIIEYWSTNYNCANTSGDTGYRLQNGVGVANLTDGYFNDKTSSIKVLPCYFVILYSDINQGGNSVTINFNIPDLSALGNYPGTSIPVKGSVSSLAILFDPTCSRYYFPYIFVE